MRLRGIENHLERSDARIERARKMEAARARDRLIRLVIKLNVGIVSILCAVYAVYVQF